jgi:fumarate reductase subunit D
MAKSNEPFWWALFGAGGMVAALFVPVTIIITGILIPANAVPSFNLLHNPLARLFLFIVISLPLFHWAHRFRYTLVDLGIKTARFPIAVACYGTACVGTVVAAVLALGIWP